MSRGVDLFEDLRVDFAPPGDYLVFIDDANRVSGFEHVLRLLHDVPAGRRVKVIATVRDYAVDRVRALAAPYGGGVVIELGPLTDEQITRARRGRVRIANHLYLERITRIAGGNPRLAVMAARLAAERNTLESIYDVSALYDLYFASIRRDLEDLSSVQLLRVAASIALFRVVDRTDDGTMQLVSEVRRDVGRVSGSGTAAPRARDRRPLRRPNRARLRPGARHSTLLPRRFP